MRATFSLLLPALLIGAPQALATVHAGDLLVTDYNGARVLAVDPDSGQVRVLSPPSGGANLLQRPTGIVMARFGVIFVVDAATDQMIGIDAATGEQFVIKSGLGVPIEVGGEPFGLALRETEGAYELWISARGSDEIRHVVGLIGFGIASEPLSTDTRWAGARGIAVHGDVLDVAVDEGQGYWVLRLDGTWIGDPFLESTIVGGTQDRSPGVSVGDVEPYSFGNVLAFYDTVFTERNVMTVIPGISACDSATSGVAARGTQTFVETKIFVTQVEPADGTPLHCPGALATGFDGALYVTDSLLASGGGAQLVRLWPAKPLADPEVVARLPDAPGSLTLPTGLAVAPVDAPEPDSGPAALSCAIAIATLAGRRRRSLGAETPTGP